MNSQSSPSEAADFIKRLPQTTISAGIVISSALYIFAQLAVIRLHAVFIPALGFYKNLSLLGCFLGIGIGFLQSKREDSSLATAGLRLLLPLLFLWILFFFNRVEIANPFPEQEAMGLVSGSLAARSFSVVVLLLIFFLTAWAFVPLGEICGRFMAQQPMPLKAYGLNLAGSLLGIVLFSVCGLAFAGGPIWILVIGLMLMPFLAFSVRALLINGFCLLLAALLTVEPVDPVKQRFYSPYQGLSLQIKNGEPNEIMTNGLYYQRLLDLSDRAVAANPDSLPVRNYYDLPYKFSGNAPADVLIVGAGSGNDVAAAIRNGAGMVDAVEIEPMIYRIGSELHPELPYQNPVVKIHLTDARQFIRREQRRYDLIVYGLLDSHAVLSARAGGVRLDSFVYTVEAFREARALLKPGGTIALSFVNMSPAFSKKMLLMLQQAFDGVKPKIFEAGYDSGLSYIVTEPPAAPAFGFQNSAAVPFTEVSERLRSLPDSVDPSTDDWPFVYMPKRAYPLNYLFVLGAALLLSLIFIVRSTGVSIRTLEPTSFFLGAAFMLLETKAITELSLLFGTVFTVISITIFAILLLSYAANFCTEYSLIGSTGIHYPLLLGAVLLSFASMSLGKAALPFSLEIWVRPLLLILPVFFAGLCFSKLVRTQTDLMPILASNLFGALFGGALEYNSMYFGFRFLYVVVFFLYLGAWYFSRFQRLPPMEAHSPARPNA